MCSWKVLFQAVWIDMRREGPLVWFWGVELSREGGVSVFSSTSCSRMSHSTSTILPSGPHPGSLSTADSSGQIILCHKRLGRNKRWGALLCVLGCFVASLFTSWNSVALPPPFFCIFDNHIYFQTNCLPEVRGGGVANASSWESSLLVPWRSHTAGSFTQCF